MKQPTQNTLAKAAEALKGRPGRPANAQANAAFDKEVDEELQRDWFRQIWDQYSAYIVVGALAIVLGVFGYKLMENRRLAASEAEGARYIAAIRQLTEGKIDTGAQTLADIGKGSSGFAALARLRLAAADAATGKPAEAVAKYEALSRERGLDPMLADFARLQTAMLQLDTASWGDIQARIADIASDTNPWRHNARELLGMAALKANKRDEARTQFEKLISDPSVPAGMAERARIVMGSLATADLAEKAPLAPAATPASPAAVSPPKDTPTKGPPASGEPAKKK